MKITRPITIIIAAILMAALSLTLIPTRIPGTAAGGANRFRGNGNFPAGGQALGNNGDTANGGNGGFITGGNGGGTGGTGGAGGFTGNGTGGFTGNGNAFRRQQTTILGVPSGTFIQIVLLTLNVAFLILGIAAAIGLFQLRHWGLVLGLVAVVYNLLMVARSMYGYIAFSIARASGSFANFGGVAGVLLGGFSRTFPYLAIVQGIIAIVVAVLMLLPMSRKALAVVSRPKTLEDLGTL